MFEKRIPKYFHSDGNGVHLKKNKRYKIILDERVLNIRVLEEYTNYYLVNVNGNYKMTINKFVNDFEILE